MATNDQETASEPFPSLSPSNTRPQNAIDTLTTPERKRASSITSSVMSATKSSGASLLSAFIDSNPPLGMWQATGEVSSKLPTLSEIKDGAFTDEGWSHEGQEERRGTNPHEIHRRRVARTSSASTKSRRSVSSMTRGIIPEERGVESSYTPTHETLAEEPSNRASIQIEDARKPKDATAENSQVLESSVSSTAEAGEKWTPGPDETGTYPNGYRFPKKHTWTQSVAIGSKGLWNFFLTPFGFVIVIYGLNVIAWGAMIFFVLLNAAPAMCHPSCNSLDSARKKWIEWDSQILNALFCVTGFGLIPWRFRDFYFLMKWRCGKGEQSVYYFRRLAGINRGWFRLPGSDKLADDIGPPPLYTKKNPAPVDVPPPYSAEEIATMERNPAIPMPVTSMPDPPLTGIRAPPTKPYKIDIVVWMYLWNTILQAALAGCMWGFNRFNRPSATTGIFISFGCVVAMAAGVVVFIEGSAVKKVEGVPVMEYDVFESIEEVHAREEKKAAKKRGHGKKDVVVGEKGEEGKDGEENLKDDGLVRVDTVKVKGQHWFTRH